MDEGDDDLDLSQEDEPSQGDGKQDHLIAAIASLTAAGAPQATIDSVNKQLKALTPTTPQTPGPSQLLRDVGHRRSLGGRPRRPRRQGFPAREAHGGVLPSPA